MASASGVELNILPGRATGRRAQTAPSETSMTHALGISSSTRITKDFIGVCLAAKDSTQNRMFCLLKTTRHGV